MKDLLGPIFSRNRNLPMPEHIALTMGGIKEWAKQHKRQIGEAYEESFFNLYKLILILPKLNIPVMSIEVLTREENKNPEYTKAVSRFLDELSRDKILKENGVRVNALGKWYEMPNEIIEPIKSLIELTGGYSRFQLNLCINYDGKEEIIDACRLIARKIRAQTLPYQDITEDTLMQNLYSSGIIPTKLVIRNGPCKIIDSFLLWHNIGAYLYDTGVNWPEFNENMLIKAIEEYNKCR